MSDLWVLYQILAEYPLDFSARRRGLRLSRSGFNRRIIKGVRSWDLVLEAIRELPLPI